MDNLQAEKKNANKAKQKLPPYLKNDSRNAMEIRINH